MGKSGMDFVNTYRNRKPPDQRDRLFLRRMTVMASPLDRQAGVALIRDRLFGIWSGGCLRRQLPAASLEGCSGFAKAGFGFLAAFASVMVKLLSCARLPSTRARQRDRGERRPNRTAPELRFRRLRALLALRVGHHPVHCRFVDPSAVDWAARITIPGHYYNAFEREVRWAQ